jgi:ABC-type branched-subunit amino acid transport system substrate-binding protein
MSNSATRRRALGAVVTVAAVGLLAACGSGGSATSGSSAASGSSGTSGSAFSVGFTTGLTGVYSAYGESLKNGFAAEVARINAVGGAAGRQIKVTYLDDAGTPDRGTSNYTQLAGSSIVVAGEVLSNVCDAIAPLAARKQVAMLCMNSGPSTIHPPQPYAFDAFVQTADWAKPSFEYAKQLVKTASPRVAVLNNTTAAGASYGDAASALAKSAGWTVDHVAIDPSDPNPASTMDQVLGQKPDAILAVINDAGAVQLFQELASANDNIPVILSGGGLSYASISHIASLNLYVLTPYLYVGPNQAGGGSGASEYAAALKTAGADPNGNYTAAGYLQADLIAKALSDCGAGCTPQALAAQLAKTNMTTAGLTAAPTAGFSSTSHQAVDSLDVYTWDPSTSGMKKVASNLAQGSK